MGPGFGTSDVPTAKGSEKILRKAIDLEEMDGREVSRPTIGGHATWSNPRREANATDPVTITVTFNVKPGCELDFERWAHEITVACSKYPGHLGASWLRSGAAYHVVYRFANRASFDAWHDSAVRAGFLARLVPIGTLVLDKHLTGMETWFEVPQHPGRPAPARWKMVVTTWTGVFPLLGLLQWSVGPYLAGLPLIFRVMALSLMWWG